MILIRLIRTILAALVAILGFAVGSAIALVLQAVTSKDATIYWRVSHHYFHWVLAVAGVRVHSKGLQYLETDGGVLLASNHQSLFDIPILTALVPRPLLFVAKKELFAIPFLGWYMRQRGDISLDRGSLKALTDMKRVGDLIKKGVVVVIFPEGTRSRDGSLGAFKRGGLKILSGAQVPIIPVEISGSYSILPRGKRLITSQTVNVTIDTPLPMAGQNEDEMISELRQRLADLLRAG